MDQHRRSALWREQMPDLGTGNGVDINARGDALVFDARTLRRRSSQRAARAALPSPHASDQTYARRSNDRGDVGGGRSQHTARDTLEKAAALLTALAPKRTSPRKRLSLDCRERTSPDVRCEAPAADDVEAPV